MKLEKFRRLPSPTTVIALIALFAALIGTAYAATNGAGKHGHHGRRGPRGATGPRGLQGPRGATGPSGVAGLEVASINSDGTVRSETGGQIVQIVHNNGGNYCFKLSKAPAGGTATLDTQDSGFPDVFLSTSSTAVSGNCSALPGANAVVQTFNSAHNFTAEAFSVIFN